jgi:hypothetical protein
MKRRKLRIKAFTRISKLSCRLLVTIKTFKSGWNRLSACLQGHLAMATLSSHTRLGPRQISNYPHQHLTNHLPRRDRRNLSWYKTHPNSKWDLQLRRILKNLRRRQEKCRLLPSERSKALIYSNQPWAWGPPLRLINCLRSSIKAWILMTMAKPFLISSCEEINPKF